MLRNPKPLGKALRKDRFANAQIAAQAVNLPRPCLSSQFFSQGFGCLRVVCFNSFVHRIILNK